VPCLKIGSVDRFVLSLEYKQQQNPIHPTTKPNLSMIIVAGGKQQTRAFENKIVCFERDVFS